MGLPTLRGGFVGGDDRRLVLNHVLVNHPSIDHAIQLFTIVHRDLYQPLPLLTFSGEFAIGKLLGLFEGGIEGGEWLFHLTNVLLHAFNAVFVWLIVRKLQQRLGDPSVAVATAAALLFAVHPFQVEAVAWVNGRMMLLSTFFGLASILTFSRWLDAPGTLGARMDSRTSYAGYAILTLVFVLFSALSKIRVGLPLLLGLVALSGGHKLRTRFWSLWTLCALVTGWFVWINIDATASADLFTKGAEHLQGPRLVRVILALAFYFQHFVWPVGLASFYPTPSTVNWSDSGTIHAALILTLSMAALAMICRISRPCRWGALWFFIAIGDTLPFFPARNVLACDRYMYLPIIGLLWILSNIAGRAYCYWTARSISPLPRWLAYSTAVVILPVLIGQSWHTAKWYNTDLLKTQRVAYLFPNEPRVWENLGWVYHQEGDYDKAIECARRELRHANPNVRGRAFQLLGMSHLDSGQGEKALRLLHHACEVDPDNAMCLYRLAMAYDDLGRLDEALPYYETAAAAAPLHNPTLYRLAALYRRLGRPEAAHRLYEQQLANNPYDVAAVHALAELEMEGETPESYRSASARLAGLLADVPDDGPARQNLAVLVLLEVELEEVPGLVQALSKGGPGPPAVEAAQAFAAHCDGRFAEAASRVKGLLRTGDADARRLLLKALERFDEKRPNVAWTYGLTAELLLADGQTQAAATFLNLFQTQCDTTQCREFAKAVGRRLSTPSPQVP